MSEETECLECDILIVGGGIAGITASIRLMQLAKEQGTELNVIILEKGATIGSHIISGAVLELKALQELLPNWQKLNLPINNPVKNDVFAFLTKNKMMRLPTPPQMNNHGNHIISLGELCAALGNYAESLGVQIFAGFPAQELLIENDMVKGVATGAFGLDINSQPLPSYQPPMHIIAKHTLLAEGAHGSLSKQLINQFNLRQGRCPQTYGLGLKEVWEIAPENHKKGEVFHSVGWPLDNRTYGGSFMYHHGENLLSLGFVVGLDYENPHLDPYEMLQTFKTHPQISPIFKGARRISYGARALNEGGLQSIPALNVAGASLIGCAAGFLNVAKIKGIHTAMKSAMIAAEEAFSAIQTQQTQVALAQYESKIKASWVGEELKGVRNIRPAFRYGLYAGLANAALEAYVLKGRAPWTFKHKSDNKTLKRADKCKPYDYAPHDGVLTFDKLTSVYLSNTNHRENQPVHLVLRDKNIPISHNLALYNAPETIYCPAGVYEIVTNETGEKQLKINAQNCVHCKTCDIKDPTQNINWVTPEGGGGCNYVKM
jgi:electron-transferring-flavoprotein dehydrogenase